MRRRKYERELTSNDEVLLNSYEITQALRVYFCLIHVQDLLEKIFI